MIPIHTTTLTIQRLLGGAGFVDPEDPPAAESWQTVATGVRAHISLPSGSERIVGGSQEEVTFRFQCDTTDLENTDRVLDEETGQVYEVTWTQARFPGFGLDHVTGGLKQVRGLVSSG